MSFVHHSLCGPSWSVGQPPTDPIQTLLEQESSLLLADDVASQVFDTAFPAINSSAFASGGPFSRSPSFDSISSLDQWDWDVVRAKVQGPEEIPLEYKAFIQGGCAAVKGCSSKAALKNSMLPYIEGQQEPICGTCLDRIYYAFRRYDTREEILKYLSKSPRPHWKKIQWLSTASNVSSPQDLRVHDHIGSRIEKPKPCIKKAKSDVQKIKIPYDSNIGALIQNGCLASCKEKATPETSTRICGNGQAPICKRCYRRILYASEHYFGDMRGALRYLSNPIRQYTKKS